MGEKINPGDLLRAHGAGKRGAAQQLMKRMKRSKASAPSKGEAALVMKKKRKGAEHIRPARASAPARGLHEEKTACKICGKTSCKHTKRKRSKKA